MVLISTGLPLQAVGLIVFVSYKIYLQKDPHTYIKIGSCDCRVMYMNLVFAVVATVSTTGMIVALPVYAEYITQAGSDLYFLLVFVAFW